MRNGILLTKKWQIVVVALIFMALSASILSATIPTTVYAKDANIAENTIQRRIPTLNDDFDDGKVIVVLNQRDSKYNGIVRIEDFKIDVEKANLVNLDTQRAEHLDRNDDVATDAVKTGRATVTDLFRVDNAKSSSLVSESDFFQILSIDLPVRGKEKVLEAIAELEKSEIVYSAEPNYSYEAIDLWVPNDTNYATNQWGLTGPNGIRAANAWNMTRGLVEIRVGLFETGAQQNHSDLNGRFLTSNFTLGAADHGTHVAGIVGAISNNNQGVAGVSQSNMMLLNRDFNSFVESMARAANNNIWVINASYEYTSGGVIENHAVAIHNYQGLLVCAAGNSTANIDDVVNRRYPAGYSAHIIPRKTFLGIETQPARPITNVITVGSIDSGGGISSFSNFGETHVQLFAPGGNILSTFPEDRCALGNETLTHPETGAVITVRRCESWTPRPGGLWARSSAHHADGYHFMSGTSMAAPHVAGVAALIRAINQNLTPQQIKAAILNNVDAVAGLSGLCVTGGRQTASERLGTHEK